MTESLIPNTKKQKKEDSTDKQKIYISYRKSTLQSTLFESNKETEVLKHIYTPSKIKKSLCYCLGFFHSFPFLIILISLLLGLIFFGLPLFLICFNIFNNIALPLLIITIFTNIFCILVIVLRLISNKKNMPSLAAKWERNNILSCTGLFFTLLILLISEIFFLILNKNILAYIENKDFIVDYEDDGLSKAINGDFFFKFIFSIFLVSPKKINQNNYFLKIKFDITYPIDIKIELVKKYLKNIFIPILIFCFNKIIKGILTKIKFQFQQYITFISGFIFSLLIIIINSIQINNNSFSPLIINKIYSIFEILLITSIYIGVTLWNIKTVFLFIGNPKDKNFAIKEYSTLLSLIIIVFDLCLFSGYTLLYLCFIFYYFSYHHNKETFQSIKYSFICLKIGFLLSIIGNSYYFGHKIMSMIFRPIALEFAPGELKDEHYIKAKRNLFNKIITSKNGLSMKDVLGRKKDNNIID